MSAVVGVLSTDLLEAFAEDVWPNTFGYLTPRVLKLRMIHGVSSECRGG
jgi:hypothetical protein